MSTLSRALGIAIAILTILHFYVSAEVATCLPGYSSLFNSLNQSPCAIGSALEGACPNGNLISPLPPNAGYGGPGPFGASIATPCVCNTVYYSLLSACSLCQNDPFYLNWTIWSENCSIIYTQTFPLPIPTLITVPHYAYLDVVTGDIFNAAAAESAGGPESSFPATTTTTSSSATILSSTIISTVTITSSLSTSTPIAQSNKSNAGAIAGGVVGGVVFFGIVAGLAFVQARKSRPSQPTPSTYSSVPMMNSGDGRDW